MDESEYLKLTPNREASNSEEYFKALDLAISNPDIKNIALTGPYGSGKSSVICSYLEQRSTIKAINISLATFAERKIEQEKQDGQDDGTPRKNNKLIEFNEQELEKGILKQLFYKVNYRKIPQSRYRKIHKHGILRTIALIFIIAICGTLVTWLWGNDIVIEKYKYACSKLEGVGASTVVSQVLILLFVVYLQWSKD